MLTTFSDFIGINVRSTLNDLVSDVLIVNVKSKLEDVPLVHLARLVYMQG